MRPAQRLVSNCHWRFCSTHGVRLDSHCVRLTVFIASLELSTADTGRVCTTEQSQDSYAGRTLFTKEKLKKKDFCQQKVKQSPDVKTLLQPLRISHRFTFGPSIFGGFSNIMPTFHKIAGIKDTPDVHC